MRDCFIKRLGELAELDRRIMLVTGDLGFGVFNEYREKLASQFINAGVAEQNMTMVGTGMAMEGHIVFTYSIGNFPTLRCLEMIRNDAAYHGANVKVVCIGGGFSYGALGISHHATEDLAIMRALPDVTVASPCGLWETEKVTEALVNVPGTCYLRLDKSVGNDAPAAGEEFIFGRMRRLRDGDSGTLIVTGGILEEVQKAAESLSESGLEFRILSCHSLKPFDLGELSLAVQETGGIVTVEEHTIHGGLGGVIAEGLLDQDLVPSRFLRIGLEEGFSSIVGSQNYLRRSYRMDAESIADRVRRKWGGAES